MPEGPEVDTDHLREEIHEELEREGGSLLRQIALTTALLAGLAAIASLKAGDTVNEALALKTEATRMQAEASDLWAYYQAKGIKAAVQDAAQSPWRAQQKSPPPELAQRVQRYATEQAEIESQARAKERERDDKIHVGDRLMDQHHRFASAVALLQVAIALGAVAALTRMRLVWFGSMLLGAAAVFFLVSPFLR